MSSLIVTSPSFANGDWIPLKHSGYGEDISPEFNLENISERTVTIAVALNDIDHPIIKNFNHWIIWNIPLTDKIPENVPHGKIIEELNGAFQGMAYGRHCYKGPKPPLNALHRYEFSVYTLDCVLPLSPEHNFYDFFIEAQGHILQKATFKGKFQKKKKTVF